MDKHSAKLLLNCIAKSAITKIPEILEKIPTVGGVISESYETVLDGIKNYQKQKACMAEESKIKKQCYDLIIEDAKTVSKPKYMSCAVFLCKDGISLSEKQKEILDCIFNEYKDVDEEQIQDVESLNTIVDFTCTYFGGSMICGEDYEIGENYINFNFCMEVLDYDQEGYVYDEKPMVKVSETLNYILGESIFKDYLIYGQDE